MAAPPPACPGHGDLMADLGFPVECDGCRGGREPSTSPRCPATSVDEGVAEAGEDGARVRRARMHIIG
jgi:hypothetical protein